MVLITGNTFPIKEKLRELGGRWDSVRRGWEVPDDKAAVARELVEAANRLPRKPHGPRMGNRRSWAPCGYPGCSPNFCDECDGRGLYGLP